MTIIYRDEKGANLTPDEVDGNFHDLDDRVQSIEDNPPEARGISEITQSGNSLFIEMTDSTQEGPFTLPDIPLVFRGEWQPSTEYTQNDIVTANGNVYLVLVTHTSDTTFDPGATSGSDGDIYGLLLSAPGNSIPAGGGEGYVLAKASSTDYDIQWQARGIPDGGLAGQFLVKLSDDDLDVDWQSAPSAAVASVSSATLNVDSENFAGIYFRCTSITGTTVNIFLDATISFDVGTELHFRQCEGAGAVRLFGESNTDGDEVIFNTVSGFEAGTGGVGAVITAKKIASNQWDVFGLLEPVSE